jgi:hypothetical protein
MSEFNTSKIDGNTVGAGEWNQLADVDNLVINSGQTPSTSNLDQLAIASARYSSGGQFFTDSGTANAYVLSPVSPFKSPVSSGAGEGYFNGMIIRFRAGNANSGASTINVNSAGVKNLKKADGTDVATGDILTTRDVSFRYDGTNFIKVENVNPATNTIQGISYLPQRITIANNSTDANNDIDFSSGNFVFSDFSGQAYVPAMTKRLDANWTAGNNNGGLDTGTKANNTWYYCYTIYNPTTQASDFLFSASATSPTLPSGFTKLKYIGSVLTNSSGNITAFKQVGNYFYFNNIFDASPSSPTSGVYSTYTLSVPRVNGIIAMVNSVIDYTGTVVVTIGVNYRITGSSIVFESFYKPTNGYDGLSAEAFVPTNNSAQIDVAFTYTAPATNFKIKTKGYIDNNL